VLQLRKFNVPIIQAAFGSNRLLNLLTDNQRKKILDNCELIDLNLGDVLGKPGDIVSYAYFPVEGIISCEKQIAGSPSLLVNLIGNEGMLCTGLVLGVNTSPYGAIVQKAGVALRISASALIHQIKQMPQLDAILKRYAYVRYNQVLQLATCNLFHLLENRLARLLLMFQDRAQSDELHITQEQLAEMLGVRRVGVTKAAGSLQRQNLISYSRGNVIIHDLEGLKTMACECYQTDKKNYESIMQALTTHDTNNASKQLPI
jgi:CRP-like cAMP-binding protein